MQDEERYMTLNKQWKRSSTQTHQLKFKETLRWYRISLGISGTVNGILALTLISLILLGPCPLEWLTYQDKCYWFSNEMKNWSESYIYCLGRKSHLLVIRDQLEMAFIQKNLRQSNYVWIGLNFTSLKRTWTWVDGSSLDPKMFFIKGPAKEKSCAATKENRIYSEACSSVFKWVCSLGVRS
ncbi:killer cell lectin-like receptor subfamily F member 1 isoform X2 [Tupaia chinensis]|uniref:killer cell lectin-like receptor subfamily F member 1 isoform X2 n=1 Tax=Tupaia chinensis TaxID=246437 RepID=UPI000FFC70EF|nr:killer cell lectin-like receptor subfamily F member 1 isoform X2 [Tupaia chinensis]